MSPTINRRSVLRASALTIVGLAAVSTESTAIAQSPRRQPQRRSQEVTLIVKFQVKSDQIELFTQRLIRQTELSRQESGCVIFNVHQSNQNPQTFWLYEKWQDQAALDFHFAQSYTKELFEFFKTSLETPVEAGLDLITELAPLPLRNYRK
jgi:quinol monooxygenase YgiN